MQPSYEHGFHIAWEAALHDTRKAFAKMRIDVVDALSGVPVNTRKRVLEALNGFQAQVDWGFDLD
jgi:hypothetical protein